MRQDLEAKKALLRKAKRALALELPAEVWNHFNEIAEAFIHAVTDEIEGPQPEPKQRDYLDEMGVAPNSPKKAYQAPKVVSDDELKPFPKVVHERGRIAQYIEQRAERESSVGRLSMDNLREMLICVRSGAFLQIHSHDFLNGRDCAVCTDT